MSLLNKFVHLDDSEKDFILLVFAFLLVALFLIITGVFDSNHDEVKTSRLYFGSQEDFTLNGIQISSCNYAQDYGTCYKLNDSLIITQNLCCKKLEKCCT